MPYLGDYLGQLVAEIALARFQGDVESLRLAELYASHPLLKHMPVPRMRIPEMTLDLPVLIEATETPPAGQSPRGGFAPKPLRERFEEVLGQHLAASDIVLNAADRRALRPILDQKLSSVTGVDDTAVNVFPLADALVTSADNYIKERAADLGRPDLELSPAVLASLKQQTRLEFLKLRTGPPRVSVLVTETELRDRGNENNVIRMRLTIGEDAVQWTNVDVGGAEENRLLPE